MGSIDAARRDGIHAETNVMTAMPDVAAMYTIGAKGLIG
jgi:hypothetical protein